MALNYSGLETQMALVFLILYNISILRNSMVQRLTRFSVDLAGRVSLLRPGAQQLQAIMQGRPAHKTWHASYLQDPWKQKLTDEINILCDQIPLPRKLELADHHIVPGNQINQILRNSILQENGLVLVNDYLYSRSGIQNYLRPQLTGNNIDEPNALNDVFSAFFWFDCNLVMGPKQSLRNNDPKENFDTEIYNLQSDLAKTAYSAINGYILRQEWVNALTAFLSLKRYPLNNVTWKKDGQGKYYVQGKNKNPPKGTAGFAYDTYVV